MKKKNFLFPTVVTLLGAVALVAGVRTCVFAEEDAVEIWRYEWTAPTTGSPVVKYAVEVSVNGAVTDTIFVVGATTVEIEVKAVTDYTIRVAGIDAANRWGPWSAPSLVDSPDVPDATNTSEANK